MPYVSANTQSKTPGDLGREALWFALHSFIAVAALFVLAITMTAFHPDATATGPMLFATLLAFVIPAAVGFAIALKTRNHVARYIWISGLLVFVAACVQVIDLPTGPGRCAECGPDHLILRIWRTFFDFSNGSGLMGGQGVLIGFWIPVALIGYCVGARLALRSQN
ncbi:MAG: hypothetical protein V4555_08815 [Acidobacteriota bacterium]